MNYALFPVLCLPAVMLEEWKYCVFPRGEDSLVKDKVSGNQWDEKEVQELHKFQIKFPRWFFNLIKE